MTIVTALCVASQQLDMAATGDRRVCWQTEDRPPAEEVSPFLDRSTRSAFEPKNRNQ